MAFKGQNGVSMAVGSGCWLVPDNATNEYFLTGVFKVSEHASPKSISMLGTAQFNCQGLN